MTWIDALAIVTIAIAFYCGWRAGLVDEFFDFGSLAVATVLAGMWSGGFAGGLPPTWPLSEAARHLMSFWILFLLIYAVMRVLGWFVANYRDWRRSGLVSGIGGGIVAAAKATLALFAILYVALFAQIDAQVRDTLRHSPIATAFDRYYPALNDTLTDMAPRLYRPLVRVYLQHHRV